MLDWILDLEGYAEVLEGGQLAFHVHNIWEYIDMDYTCKYDKVLLLDLEVFI